HCHARNHSDIKQSLLVETFPQFGEGVSPLEAETVLRSCARRGGLLWPVGGRLQLQEGVLLLPGAPLFPASAQARMDEHLRAAAIPKTAAEILQFRVGLDGQQQKRRGA